MSQRKEGTYSRRRFLGLSSCALAGVTVGSQVTVLKALAEKGEVGALKEGADRSVFTNCAMCINNCGVIARVKDGVIQKLDPNPHFIKSRAMLCARGNAGIKAVYDPDRLKYPLIRVGERGEGKWRRASWEEALDLVAKNMNEIAEKYTRAGMMFASTKGFQEGYFTRLAECYGSTNTLRHPTLCLASLMQGFGATFGTVPTPDVLNADYIIISGANRTEGIVTPDTIDLVRGEGGRRKIVYLDPRFTKTAAKADEWYAVKPGGDFAFILAMTHVIVTEELYDKAFVAEKTVGFEKLVPHIQQYTPEWAQPECEIPAKDIRRIAREFAAAAPKAVYYPGRRSSFFENDTQMRRAMAILNAIVGNWDVKGGLVPNSSVKLKKNDYLAPWYDGVPSRLDKDAATYLSNSDGSWKFFRDRVIEGKPYPVKGMMVYKQNPVSSVPNRSKTLQMMDQMDFICTIDIAMSDTAWYSDVVLPEATYLERRDPAKSTGGILPVVTRREQVVQALFEAKPNLWIMQQIAKRLGDEVYESFDFTLEQYDAHQLKGRDDIKKALETRGVYYPSTEPTYGKSAGQRFRTKSGKIEIYSEKYAENGLDPLPVYTPQEHPPKDRYRLVVGRTAYLTQNTTNNNAYLSELVSENGLWLNTAEARRRGLKNGQLVRVRSSVGEERLRLEVTDKIRPDTVYMENGFGILSQTQSRVFGKGGSNTNLLEDRACPISGNFAMHHTFVEIQPA